MLRTRPIIIFYSRCTGASIHPEAMMHFPSVSDFPPFPKNFQTPWKISKTLPFPEKLFDFHPPKFLMTFFSHQLQISNFPPIFGIAIHSLCFDKIILSPYLYKFPPCFRQIYVFFTYFLCFTFPPTFTMMHLCITQCPGRFCRRRSFTHN